MNIGYSLCPPANPSLNEPVDRQFDWISDSLRSILFFLSARNVTSTFATRASWGCIFGRSTARSPTPRLSTAGRTRTCSLAWPRPAKWTLGRWSAICWQFLGCFRNMLSLYHAVSDCCVCWHWQTGFLQMWIFHIVYSPFMDVCI